MGAQTTKLELSEDQRKRFDDHFSEYIEIWKQVNEEQKNNIDDEDREYVDDNYSSFQRHYSGSSIELSDDEEYYFEIWKTLYINEPEPTKAEVLSNMGRYHPLFSRARRPENERDHESIENALGSKTLKALYDLWSKVFPENQTGKGLSKLLGFAS